MATNRERATSIVFSARWPLSVDALAFELDAAEQRGSSSRDAEVAELKQKVSGLEGAIRIEIESWNHCNGERERAEARVAELEAELAAARTPGGSR